jgi:S-adenosylmethionine:tRNA ribosyltransferase-isomerase
MSHQPLPLDAFDYDLPEACIAQHPAQPRDHSRLLVLPDAAPAVDKHFFDLPDCLAPGDLLVVNRTEVIPARLNLHKDTGGRVEALLHTPVDGPLPTAHTWEALGRPGSAFVPGARLHTAKGDVLTVVGRQGAVAQLQAQKPIWTILQAEGTWPLPPYIARAKGATPQDGLDYQSIFAQTPGAVAAPTASLHFTPQVTAAVAARGVATADVVLHVGPGTFLPIREVHAGDVRQHPMHGERYVVPEATQAAIASTRAAGGRVIAVGTTALRALETWAASGVSAGVSSLFIYPGYSFRTIDGLITNFHVPKSTLLLLVCALAGRERILAAYAHAKASGYRFFSYGDAMLIFAHGVHHHVA